MSEIIEMLLIFLISATSGALVGWFMFIAFLGIKWHKRKQRKQ